MAVTAACGRPRPSRVAIPACESRSTEHLAADAVTDIKQVEGLVARDSIKPKEQIRTSDLVRKGHAFDLSDEITPGTRAITIGANEIIGSPPRSTHAGRVGVDLAVCSGVGGGTNGSNRAGF